MSTILGFSVDHARGTLPPAFRGRGFLKRPAVGSTGMRLPSGACPDIGPGRSHSATLQPQAGKPFCSPQTQKPGFLYSLHPMKASGLCSAWTCLRFSLPMALKAQRPCTFHPSHGVLISCSPIFTVASCLPRSPSSGLFPCWPVG